MDQIKRRMENQVCITIEDDTHFTEIVIITKKEEELKGKKENNMRAV